MPGAHQIQSWDWKRTEWHSRSRSCSRSGSQTRNTHSIEIDWYDIDDIDILRTFHSISRSKTVAAIPNDTDPDGKTKILMKLRVKLPYRNVADIMEVKVNEGAKANILPLHTFRSMFPHKLDEDGYPKDQKKMPSEDQRQHFNATTVASWWIMEQSHCDSSIMRKIHFKTISSLLLKHQLGKRSSLDTQQVSG